MQTGIRELKRVLASMRGRIDKMFTAAEKRKLLKDIATGVIKDGNELRRHVGRVEGVKKKKVKEQTATLTGKVIDAGARQPIGNADVTIQQTSFNETTDNSGNFIWDGMIKGRAIRVNVKAMGFKPNQTEYQAVMDNEQFIVVKMVRLQGGGKKNDKDKKGH